MKSALLVIAGLVLVGCGKEELVRTETAVIRKIELRKADGEVASGMDLDGVVSDGRDSRSCFKKDFVDAAGRPGIDNQLATLLPLVDLLGEGALQGLVQNAINEGRLLVFIDVMQWESGRVEMTARRGDDKPLLGTDGFLLPGQTLALHAEPVLGDKAVGEMVDRVVITEPFALTFPVIVFSNLYLLSLPDARVRFELTEDGKLEGGLIAGSATVEQLLGLVAQAEVFGGDFGAVLNNALVDSADLERDASGKCAAMSMAIDFDAVPAYIFE